MIRKTPLGYLVQREIHCVGGASSRSNHTYPFEQYTRTFGGYYCSKCLCQTPIASFRIRSKLHHTSLKQTNNLRSGCHSFVIMQCIFQRLCSPLSRACVASEGLTIKRENATFGFYQIYTCNIEAIHAQYMSYVQAIL